MRIFIGSDNSGSELRAKLIRYLISRNFQIVDMSKNQQLDIDYPDVAVLVCKKVLKTKNSLGILICGTGMGMCLAANKIKGIRATLCTNKYCAEKSRSSNDANILTLGALEMSYLEVRKIVNIWLGSYHVNENSRRKVNKILRLESNFGKI